MKLTADLIEGFVGSVLSKNFAERVPSPECHKEWWELCCSDNKFVAIAAPRGHAKSTAITLAYVLASVLFRDREFVIIVSDTEAQSILFLNDIKKELTENEDIINLFGVRKIEKDAETDIIVRMDDGHRLRIMAKGSEQKLRGMKWRNRRPDLIVGDDLENDEIVMNPERRYKFRRWMRGALMPCLSRRGVMRIVGTILHIDSFLENLMPRMKARTTVLEELKMYSKNDNAFWKSIKYKAHNPDFSCILWPERFSEYEFRRLRQEAVDAGDSDIYNQEYLNYPIDDTRALFRRDDLIPIPDGEMEDIIRETKPLHYFVGTDLAVSTKTRADYSAFVVAGIDAVGKMYIVEIVRDRMESLEIVDTFFMLQEKYNPEWFAIEKGALEKAIGPFLREQMFERQLFPMMVPITASVDKEERSKSIQARVRVRGVKFFKEGEWYPTFEEELVVFPRGKYDDQVDAFAMIGLALEKITLAPTAKELEEEAYEEELKQSEFYQQGRSKHTGY